MIHADSIKIDTDEGRYVLLIEDSSFDGPHSFDIHDVVLDFYASVQKEIRPYVLEAESARRSLPVDGADLGVEFQSGYALDDPKHPTYHERMVGDA